jgi:hypothetical protein
MGGAKRRYLNHEMWARTGKGCDVGLSVFVRLACWNGLVHHIIPLYRREVVVHRKQSKGEGEVDSS